MNNLIGKKRTLMLLFIFIAVVVCFSGSVSAATLEVGTGQTYTTINSAVTAAGANDVINVHSGTYAENVVIGKSNLVVQANTGDAVNVQTTGSSTAFSVNNANFVTIQGFNIQGNDVNSGYGLTLNTASNCNIVNNNISNYYVGTYVTGSSNTISGNTYYNTYNAVYFNYPSNNNVISGNNISNPSYDVDLQTRTGIREQAFYFGTWTPNVGNQYLNNNISKVNEAIFVQQGSNFIISGNHISIVDSISYAWGLTLSVGNTPNANLIISNNVITSEGKVNFGSRGIYLISNPSSPLNTNLQIFGNDISNFTDGIIGILYTPTGTPTTQIYLNRFANNTRSLGMNGATPTMTVEAINNWWGKNSGLVVSTSASQPLSYDIWYNAGTLTYDPWIVLNVSANPTDLTPGGTSTVTADLTLNSNGEDTTLLYPGKYVPNGIPVTFAGDALGDVAPTSSSIINGQASTTFTAGNVGGVSHPTATVDAATVQTDVAIAGPPVITNWDPAKGTTNVPADKVINITFNKDIMAGTNFIELKDKSGTLIPINISILGNILTLTPVNPLAENKYTIYLHTGCVTDLLGNPVAQTNSNFISGTPPTVTTWDPAKGATNVPATKVIQITFSEAIKAGTMFIELKNKAGTLIPITTSIAGNLLKIKPVSPLAENKYTIYLHTGCVTDMAGNPVAQTNSNFISGTPPTVTTWDPASNSTNIARNKVIKVTFSEAIKAGNNFIELKTGSGTVVPITTSISGSVLTIKHASLLAANTKYTIILHTGCVTDMAGNPVANVSSKFTTGA